MGDNCTIVVSKLLFASTSAPYRKLEAAGYAADGGGDVGIGQIELRVAHANFGLLQGCTRDGIFGNRVIVLTLADGLGFEEITQAVFFALGLYHAGPLFRKLGLCLRQCVLVGYRIDQEQGLTRLYLRSFLVQAFEQDAADARTYLNLLGAFGLGNRFRTDRHAGRLNFDYAYRERHARGGLRGRLITFAACA